MFNSGQLGGVLPAIKLHVPRLQRPFGKVTAFRLRSHHRLSSGDAACIWGRSRSCLTVLSNSVGPAGSDAFGLHQSGFPWRRGIGVLMILLWGKAPGHRLRSGAARVESRIAVKHMRRPELREIPHLGPASCRLRISSRFRPECRGISGIVNPFASSSPR